MQRLNLISRTILPFTSLWMCFDRIPFYPSKTINLHTIIHFKIHRSRLYGDLYAFCVFAYAMCMCFYLSMVYHKTVCCLVQFTWTGLMAVVSDVREMHWCLSVVFKWPDYLCVRVRVSVQFRCPYNFVCSHSPFAHLPIDVWFIFF